MDAACVCVKNMMRWCGIALLGAQVFVAVGADVRPDPVLCELNSTQCGRHGSNSTDGCKLLFVDIGANIGQSLHQWYHSSDAGRGAAEYGKVVGWKQRRLYCADVFEGNPAFNNVLLKEAAYHRNRVQHPPIDSTLPVCSCIRSLLRRQLRRENMCGFI